MFNLTIYSFGTGNREYYIVSTSSHELNSVLFEIPDNVTEPVDLKVGSKIVIGGTERTIIEIETSYRKRLLKDEEKKSNYLNGDYKTFDYLFEVKYIIE